MGLDLGFWRSARSRQIPAGSLILFILADVVGDCRLVPGAVSRRGRRSLGGKGPAEGGRRGAVVRGAAAGALLGADGLQHPALALLQHVFLGWKQEGR